MTNPCIELRDCSLTATQRKKASNAVRLQPTTMQFPSGEVTAVIGPNGAGKSTLLGLAAGMLQPTTGSVLINDREIHRMSARELARERAVLTQDEGVIFGFTVAEVVQWGRTPWQGFRSPTGAQSADIVISALKAVDMHAERERPINELSGGERKRVHLARIIAQQASILLLDEPDSDLDLSGLQSLDRAIRRMNVDGTTVVLTSHDLGRISRLATHVVLVAQGCVLAQGDVRTVVTSETLSEAYRINVRVHWGDDGATVST